jgi:hypothetical protein
MSLLEAISRTSVAAYDGCHKIYLTHALHKDIIEGYEIFEGSIEERMKMVESWWDKSCSLRFIEIFTIYNDKLVFTEVIPQGSI